jgi:hypothetical protein
MSITLSTLPAVGAELEGGAFAGVITQADGTHAAVVLLPERAKGLTWDAATEWAKQLGAQLPTRLMASTIYTHLKAQLEPRWHWTCETDEDDASCAWLCDFDIGNQDGYRKSYEGCAVAARLIPLTA